MRVGQRRGTRGASRSMPRRRRTASAREQARARSSWRDQRRRVRVVGRAEAAVAVAAEARADRAAAGARHRPEAGRRRCATRTHGVAAALALQAHAARPAGRAARRAAARSSTRSTCCSFDRAALDLGVDLHVVGDRRRGRQRRRSTRAAGRRARFHSSTSARLRSAWMPPAVAQAPIVTRVRRLLADRGAMRSASCGVVMLPSTSATSQGPASHAARGLEEVRDLDALGERQQLVLEVQDRAAGSRRRRRT